MVVKYPGYATVLQVLDDEGALMFEWLLIPAAYLLGSVSCAIITCRLMGLADPREQGSGNPGATNVMRIGGKKAAGITLLGDMLKGFFPVYLANVLGMSPSLQALVGLAAFLGHLYPMFFGFKGGKGVATSLGVLLGFSWILGFTVIGTWLLVYKLRKISSLSALTASVLSPIYAWFILGDKVIAGAALVMTVLLLVRHKGNIRRLLAGEE
ncbi:glycerol-3-phosphate acyltransferase PlsY [Methyloglobulus morosus KoM1]|uniref:Glycerol-3-phosphate acyltransferase n=2 Tax=Methyloglobulus TaxID=1410680 RepID=V5BAH9_9GAMM|nr:glycerol-3-phosphate acyltransferase PlsY [Methyloglobulus morosus KoM1]